MTKLLLLILFCAAHPLLRAQQMIYAYKDIAVREAEKQFEKIPTQTKWALQSLMDEDSSSSFFGNSFMPVNQEMSIASITFLYIFFSRQINDWYYLPITVLKNMELDKSNDFFANIPPCITRDSGCSFIKKDSAVNIALRNGLQIQPSDVQTFFYSTRAENQYYWLVGANLERQADSRPGTYTKINSITGIVVK